MGFVFEGMGTNPIFFASLVPQMSGPKTEKKLGLDQFLHSFVRSRINFGNHNYAQYCSLAFKIRTSAVPKMCCVNTSFQNSALAHSFSGLW